MSLSAARTSAGIAAVLGNLPLITLPLAAMFLGERMTTSKLSSLLLELGGVTLIACQALNGPATYEFWGAGLALGVSIVSATSHMIVKRSGVLQPATAHGHEPAAVGVRLMSASFRRSGHPVGHLAYEAYVERYGTQCAAWRCSSTCLCDIVCKVNEDF